MSTLPFLLSVADELDNIHSQSYMDDFGLGFHPHRQYYRSPTIQLSLPASTEWTTPGSRHTRYRSYKFYDDTQNNVETVDNDNPTEDDNDEADNILRSKMITSMMSSSTTTKTKGMSTTHDQYQLSQPPLPLLRNAADDNLKQATQVASQANTKISTTANATAMVKSSSHDVGVGGLGLNLKSGGDDDDENIDRTVRMYNLSKKCCKNYYRHALETGPNGRNKCHHGGSGGGGTSVSGTSVSGQPSSSSEESLQKMPSPIEFLTCFLVKKSRSSSKCSTKHT